MIRRFRSPIVWIVCLVVIGCIQRGSRLRADGPAKTNPTEAKLAIEKLGTSLVPNEIYGRTDHSAPEAAIRAIGPASIPALTEALSDKRWFMRQAGAEGLGWFPVQAGPAAPTLINLLADEAEQVRSQAADTLGLIYKAASSTRPKTSQPVIVGPLRDALTNANPVARIAAARAILQADPGDAAAMNELRRSVTNDPYARRDAAQKKFQAHRDDPAAIAEWQRSVAENKADNRVEAVRALIQLGPAALPALPELTAAAQADRNVGLDLVEFATEAIGKIGPKAKAAVPALMDLLGVPDANVHGRAAHALAQIGPDALLPLIAALSDPAPAKRKAATWALGEIGPRASAAIPELRRLTSDPNPLVVMGAKDALSRVEKQ
jgi:HEAT repeat protein